MFNWPVINRFILRLSLLTVIYSFCRIIFYTFNSKAFNNAGLSEFLIGIRFDITAIFLTNIPVFVLATLPFNFTENKYYKIVVSTLFIVLNTTAIAFNLADTEYFPFSNKRSTAELFKIVGSGSDFWKLLPSYIVDFWYLFILLIAIIYLLIYFERRINKTKENASIPIWKKSIVFILICGICLVGARGGVQYIPLHIMHASKYTHSANTALVLNTPFTLIKSAGNNELKPLIFFSEEELNSIVNNHHQYSFKGKFLPMNIVIIIMESFSKEYIGSLSGNTSYTPFLD
ncbi:MAG: hypothetical protein ACK4ON_09325, partial [Bacteroidia bacterium]